MKIALIGFGKMGQLIEEVAQKKGHQITMRSTSRNKLKDCLETLSSSDVAIDFSHPSNVLEHLEMCLDLKKPLVIGTTGWEEKLSVAKQRVNQKNGSCLFAPNFSLGIYLFQQVLSYAASLFSSFNEYDVTGIEYHHRHKLDSPSGTAKALTNKILEQMPHLQDLNFSSVRCGHIPGTHTIHFDSEADYLTFTHEARNRKGFAAGAVWAAEQILNREGFFTFEDLMKNYTGKTS